MNDNDIIKALEHCVSSSTSEACDGCPFNENDICDKEYNATEKYALDLINRQKAEIERLQKYNTDIARKHYNDGRAEAITEFAERLKKEVCAKRFMISFKDIDQIAKEIEAATGVESRATVLGHVQRGGNPTVRDRVMASYMGNAAVELLAKGVGNRVICYDKGEILNRDIYEALQMKKPFDVDGYRVADTISL